MTPSVIIALLSFLVSAVSFFFSFYEWLIKPKVQVRWTYLSAPGFQYNICLMVTNMSSRAANITKLKLFVRDQEHISTYYPVVLTQDSVTNKVAYSDCIPLNIPARTAKTFVIAFQNIRNIQELQKLQDASTIKLKYKINRRTIIKNFDNKVILDTDAFANSLLHKQK